MSTFRVHKETMGLERGDRFVSVSTGLLVTIIRKSLLGSVYYTLRTRNNTISEHSSSIETMESHIRGGHLIPISLIEPIQFVKKLKIQ